MRSAHCKTEHGVKLSAVKKRGNLLSSLHRFHEKGALCFIPGLRIWFFHLLNDFCPPPPSLPLTYRTRVKLPREFLDHNSAPQRLDICTIDLVWMRYTFHPKRQKDAINPQASSPALQRNEVWDVVFLLLCLPLPSTQGYHEYLVHEFLISRGNSGFAVWDWWPWMEPRSENMTISLVPSLPNEQWIMATVHTKVVWVCISTAKTAVSVLFQRGISGWIKPIVNHVHATSKHYLGLWEAHGWSCGWVLWRCEANVGEGRTRRVLHSCFSTDTDWRKIHLYLLHGLHAPRKQKHPFKQSCESSFILNTR